MTGTPVTSGEFTQTQARLVLECSATYDPDKVRRAALWMLGCMDASGHELALATRALCAAEKAA